MSPNQKIYHISKKVLWEPVHSIVVPKGSPLEVRFTLSFTYAITIGLFSLFQSPFNNALSRLQDMGIIMKLMDNGYYEAFGRTVQISSKDIAAEKLEPMANQGVIFLYVTYFVGIALSTLIFIIELLLSNIRARCSQDLHKPGPRDISWISGGRQRSNIGARESWFNGMV